MAIVMTLAMAFVMTDHAYHLLRAEILVYSAARQNASLKTLEEIERAGDFYPDYAPYVDHRADQEISLGRQSMAGYIIKKLIVLRPSWPYAWARLSYVMMLGGEYGEPLHKTLRATAQYAEHDPVLVDWMARQAILRWDRFNAQTKDILRGSLHEALATKNPDLLSFAISNHRESAICEDVNATDAVKRWCTAVSDRNSVCSQTRNDAESRKACEEAKVKLTSGFLQ